MSSVSIIRSSIILQINPSTGGSASGSGTRYDRRAGSSLSQPLTPSPTPTPPQARLNPMSQQRFTPSPTNNHPQSRLNLANRYSHPTSAGQQMLGSSGKLKNDAKYKL